MINEEQEEVSNSFPIVRNRQTTIDVKIDDDDKC